MALISTIFNALFRKGILVGVALLALIALAELGLWLFAPVSPYVMHRYTFRNTMQHFGLPSESVFEVDSRELRKRPAAEGRDQTAKVLIIGGEGNYQPLQSAAETWWGRLANTLESRHPELGIEVGLKASPAGLRSGTSSSLQHSLAWAKAYVPELKPDFMVVSFGVSEVLDVKPDYQYNPMAIKSIAPASVAPRMKDKMVRLSQIARRLRHWRHGKSENVKERREMLEQPNHFLRVLGHQRTIYEKLPFDVMPPTRTEGADPKLEYLDGLRSFHRLAERAGAELIVLSEPTMHDDMLGFKEMARLRRPRWTKRPTVKAPQGTGYRPDPSWVEQELNRYYDAAKTWADKAGVPFVDLNRDWVLGKGIENFVDDTTLTQIGSQRVADEVGPTIDAFMKKFLAE